MTATTGTALWDALVARFQALVPTTFKKLFAGNLETFIEENTQMPCIFLEPKEAGPNPLAVPRRRQDDRIYELRAKVRNTDNVQLTRDAISIGDIMLNTVEGVSEADFTYGSKITVNSARIVSMDKLGDQVREIKITVTFKSQVVAAGAR